MGFSMNESNMELLSCRRNWSAVIADKAKIFVLDRFSYPFSCRCLSSLTVAGPSMIGMCMSRNMMSKGVFALAWITSRASSPFSAVLIVFTSGMS